MPQDGGEYLHQRIAVLVETQPWMTSALTALLKPGCPIHTLSTFHQTRTEEAPFRINSDFGIRFRQDHLAVRQLDARYAGLPLIVEQHRLLIADKPENILVEEVNIADISSLHFVCIVATALGCRLTLRA